MSQAVVAYALGIPFEDTRCLPQGYDWSQESDIGLQNEVYSQSFTCQYCVLLAE